MATKFKHLSEWVNFDYAVDSHNRRHRTNLTPVDLLILVFLTENAGFGITRYDLFLLLRESRHTHSSRQINAKIEKLSEARLVKSEEREWDGRTVYFTSGQGQTLLSTIEQAIRRSPVETRWERIRKLDLKRRKKLRKSAKAKKRS